MLPAKWLNHMSPVTALKPLLIQDTFFLEILVMLFDYLVIKPGAGTTKL